MNVPPAAPVVALLTLLAPGQVASADDTFFESDEYQDGEAAANKFLKEADYRLMFEDLERNDVEFDWGWLRTPGYSDTPAAEPASGGKLRDFFFRSRGARRAPTANLGFRLSDYKTVYIPTIRNFAGICPKEHLEEIRSAFVEAVLALELAEAPSAEAADLELELALMDQLRSDVNVPVYGIHVEPFIELELRLRERSGGNNLLLLRNRKHGDDHAEAALNYADDLVKFLR